MIYMLVHQEFISEDFKYAMIAAQARQRLPLETRYNGFYILKTTQRALGCSILKSTFSKMANFSDYVISEDGIHGHRNADMGELELDLSVAVDLDGIREAHSWIFGLTSKLYDSAEQYSPKMGAMIRYANAVQTLFGITLNVRDPRCQLLLIN